MKPNEQLDLPLQDLPRTDIQRWSRLIPTHIQSRLQLHGWAQLPIEQIHTELKIHAGYPQAEDMIMRLCLLADRYDDEHNVRLGELFKSQDWYPPEPTVKLNPGFFQKLEQLFQRLGCVHIYDIFIVGNSSVILDHEQDESVQQLWDYLHIYAGKALRTSIQQDQEETDENATSDYDDLRSRIEELTAQINVRNSSVRPTVGHTYYRDTHTHETHNDNRQGIGFYKMMTIALIASIIGATAVQREWLQLGKIKRDFYALISMFQGKETPKAIQVTPEQMRELEAQDKQ